MTTTPYKQMVKSYINQYGVVDLTWFFCASILFDYIRKPFIVAVSIFGWLPAPSGWVWLLTVNSVPGGITK